MFLNQTTLMTESSDIPTSHLALTKSLTHALRRRCGVEEGSHILISVSGGADSVALLRALDALKDRRRWRLTLTVAHVQHHLRDEAEADAGYVDELAQQLKLPCLRRDLDLSKEAGNVEDVARQKRYAALGEMAHECGASFVATGHHGDDQLETLLMRMLRGAGTKGMSGIAWRRTLGTDDSDRGPVSEEDATDQPPFRHSILIRPMLAVTRVEVVDYLNAIGQAWREDHTNTDTTRWRARLRAEVLPVLEAIRSGAGRKATAFAEQLHGVHRVLDDAVRDAHQLVMPCDGGVVLDREGCRGLRRVVLSGLLRDLLIADGVPADTLNAQQVGRVVRAIRDNEGGERTFTFAAGTTVTVIRERVTVLPG